MQQSQIVNHGLRARALREPFIAVTGDMSGMSTPRADSTPGGATGVRLGLGAKSLVLRRITASDDLNLVGIAALTDAYPTLCHTQTVASKSLT